MTVLDRKVPSATGTPGVSEEALIKEARRLRRRRWMIGSLLAALAGGAGLVGFLFGSGPPSGSHHRTSKGSTAAGSLVAGARSFVPTHSPDLIEPTTLASLPNGDLLILDSSRDQILQLKPDGALSVFAGNGRLGFDGDGGPAQDAELDLTYFSTAAITVAPDGTVDFLDNGDCRIRAIDPSGMIRTVVRVPLVTLDPHGTACLVTAVAVSPSGRRYVATDSEIQRVSSTGHLVWVAGAHGSAGHESPYLTPSHVAFFPSSMAFSKTGDLYIANSSPKVIFKLSPTGKLTQIGPIYATQLTTGQNGMVLAGTHGGEIQKVTTDGVRSLYSVIPKRVAGINWGRDGGFQENGIANAKNGTIYVDNAEGNGYGAGSVVVRISPTRHATLIPIRTQLAATLPKLGAPGFPASLYPPALNSRATTLTSCPNGKGLERFTPRAIMQATNIASTYHSSQFASDIAVTDRSWWTADFNDYADGNNLGRHTVVGETPASKSPVSAALTAACGPELVDDSITVRVRPSAYSDFAGTLYFLDRSGHPLVYDVR